MCKKQYERTTFFWVITQREVVIPYRRDGQIIGHIFKGQELRR